MKGQANVAFLYVHCLEVTNLRIEPSGLWHGSTGVDFISVHVGILIPILVPSVQYAPCGTEGAMRHFGRAIFVSFRADQALPMPAGKGGCTRTSAGRRCRLRRNWARFREGHACRPPEANFCRPIRSLLVTGHLKPLLAVCGTTTRNARTHWLRVFGDADTPFIDGADRLVRPTSRHQHDSPASVITPDQAMGLSFFRRSMLQKTSPSTPKTRTGRDGEEFGDVFVMRDQLTGTPSHYPNFSV